LTPRQTKFIAEYLKDLSATQAAIRAGYSAKNANVDGSRLLANAGIAAAIAAGKARQLKGHASHP
jgi:phage terminase small subunit